MFGSAEGSLMWVYSFLFCVSLWQNTNGVNFYNILTQEPEELKEKPRVSTGNFIGKAPIPPDPLPGQRLTVEACH